MTQKTTRSFTICHIFALEINCFPVLLSVRALLAWSPKRNKRKVISGTGITLPVNFACKPGLSFNPLARVTLAVGLPYLLVNRALDHNGSKFFLDRIIMVTAETSPLANADAMFYSSKSQ